MPWCVLRYCSNNSRNTTKCQGITFHRFPRPENPKDRDKWIEFVRKNRSEHDWIPSDCAQICSVHFREEDRYTSKTGRVYLKKTAVPTIDDRLKKCNKRNRKKTVRRNSSTSSETKEKIDIAFETTQHEISLIKPENDQNRLKSIIVKEKEARKKLAYKVKKLQRQIRTLKKKCETYKEVVVMLKKKYCIDCQTESDCVRDE